MQGLRVFSQWNQGFTYFCEITQLFLVLKGQKGNIYTALVSLGFSMILSFPPQAVFISKKDAGK
jgi:hypothetical protein